MLIPKTDEAMTLIKLRQGELEIIDLKQRITDLQLINAEEKLSNEK